MKFYAKPGSDPRIHIQPLKSTRAGPFGAKGHIRGTQTPPAIGKSPPLRTFLRGRVCCLLLSGGQVPERGRRSTKISVTIATELLAYYKSTQRSAIIVQVDEEGR
ncbi:unnamed protein product [Boreogadus saida]